VIRIVAHFDRFKRFGADLRFRALSFFSWLTPFAWFRLRRFGAGRFFCEKFLDMTILPLVKLEMRTIDNQEPLFQRIGHTPAHPWFRFRIHAAECLFQSLFDIRRIPTGARSFQAQQCGLNNHFRNFLNHSAHICHCARDGRTPVAFAFPHKDAMAASAPLRYFLHTSSLSSPVTV